jgi:hypothetical protein
MGVPMPRRDGLGRFTLVRAHRRIRPVRQQQLREGEVVLERRLV